MASELYLPEQQIFIGIELRIGGDFYLPFFILKNVRNTDFRLLFILLLMNCFFSIN